jgi:hypothetical protein
MIYNPSLSEAQLEKEFSKLRKLKYNQFRWWRMYDNPKPPKPKQSPLIDKIKNGDFDYSHYRFQAMWCEHEMNKIYKKIGPEDMGRFVEETSLLRSRRKRLLEDYFKDENNKLETLANEFSKIFRISKDKVKTYMGEFGGTIEELYYYISDKHEIKIKEIPHFLKHRP